MDAREGHRAGGWGPQQVSAGTPLTAGALKTSTGGHSDWPSKPGQTGPSRLS